MGRSAVLAQSVYIRKYNFLERYIVRYIVNLYFFYNDLVIGILILFFEQLP